MILSTLSLLQLKRFISVKRTCTDFTHRSLFTDLGEYHRICEKKFYKKVSYKPQVMSLESASVGAEDYKFENKIKKSEGCGVKNK